MRNFVVALGVVLAHVGRLTSYSALDSSQPGWPTPGGVSA